MDRIERLHQYLQTNPTDAFLQHALALEYIKIGNDAKAKALFEEILLRDATYVGSYYHLGKLLERTGETAAAIEWYQQGLTAAKAAGDNHSFNELRAALDDLVD